MTLYALVSGVMTVARKDGPRTAVCYECDGAMLAKTGDVVIHHWAHRAENPHCSTAGEGEWHLAWKMRGAEGTQENKVGNRRADVLAPGGFAVEFQASPLTAAEVLGREADWKRKLVWVFDAREAYEEERIVLRRPPGKPLGDAYRNIRWSHAPERMKAPKCATLLDLDGELLLFLGKWYDNAQPVQGYGWLVTKGWVVEEVLHGQGIPQPPGYKQYVNAEELKKKAAQKQAERLTQAREFSSFKRTLAQIPKLAPTPPCRGPRLWEPDTHIVSCCIRCGRITARYDEPGLPYCKGAYPVEPEEIKLLRDVLGAEIIG